MRQRCCASRRPSSGILLSGVEAGVGAFTSSVAGAQEQQSQGPGGIEWLDYDRPRRIAAGARVGNVLYLSGENGSGPDIVTQTEDAFQNIQKRLSAFGSDFQYIFKMGHGGVDN